MKRYFFIILILIGLQSTAQNKDQQMIQAAYDGDLATVTSLLNSGANPNAIDKNSYTAIIYACAYGYEDIVKLLISKKANVTSFKNDVNPMFAAVNNDNTKIIRILIDAGASVNVKDANGYTPLMFAAQEGYDKTVKFLLKNGADINVESKVGHTALSIAIQNDRESTVKLLLSYNPKKKGYSIYGTSPLYTAQYLNKASSEKLLKKYGMKKTFTAPNLGYVTAGMGVNASLYEILINYEATLHENVYNFDLCAGYYKNTDSTYMKMITSNTTYTIINGLYANLNKNFKLITFKTGALGLTIGANCAGLYGINQSLDRSYEFVYGANGGFYYTFSGITLKANYIRFFTPQTIFYNQQLMFGVSLKLYSFKSSKSNYIFSDKTLYML